MYIKIKNKIMFVVAATIFNIYSLPSSAVVGRSRCNRGSEGSVWGDMARPIWQCSHDGMVSLANRSTLWLGTLNLYDQPPKNIHSKHRVYKL